MRSVFGLLDSYLTFSGVPDTHNALVQLMTGQSPFAYIWSSPYNNNTLITQPCVKVLNYSSSSGTENGLALLASTDANGLFLQRLCD